MDSSSPISTPIKELPQAAAPRVGGPATSAAAIPELTVIVPVFNERNTLLDMLERVRSVPISKEIVIVDDCSTDGTRELLAEKVEGKFPDVRVRYHEANAGKGSCIRTALQFASGRYTIIQDADLEYSPEDFPAIIETFEKTGADAVYGSRFLHGWPAMRPANKIVNKLLAWMVRLLYRTPMTDEATCYKAFRTDVVRSIPLECRRFEFCPEVTAKLIRRNYKIVETPIRYEARSMAQGKKIRWTDGVAAIWALIKYRFTRL
jgi:glycosyltransferase involved in cell wall biosynthesis